METKKKNLKARFYKLFKSSNCTMTTKNIAKSVDNSVHFSPLSYHHPRSDDANTLFNLHRSLSVPFFSDDQPHSHIHHNLLAFHPSKASHKLRRAPSEFNLFWDKNFIASKKKFLRSNPYGFTSSASSSDIADEEEEEDDGGLFSSEEFETGTPFSSRQFSSDSSEFYYNPSLSGRKKISPMTMTGRRRLPPRPPRKLTTTNTYKKKLKRPSRKAKKVVEIVQEEEEEEEDEEEEVPCNAYAYTGDGDDDGESDGRGVAEVKDSTDPYADFSISMLEMIVKKQLFGRDKLESLLQCYLSLNQTHNHPIILRVFADICKTVLG
ncbi:hypothetical protein ZOSMA_9G00120 [Zostera marina]|uniref:Transcription repressor n=1 Tax=Zostera marina TaxID=29655 RepID=A0A0K9NGK8_ZOSMR|nr:hypothetical protein ZOSMA_9G00120 [Zostera marina]